MIERALNQVRSFKPWQVACIIALVGAATFFSGLNGGFQGDDNFQIVQNVPVHSLLHFFKFFSAGTFYNGYQLTGDYYRPLMSVTFSAIYTLFGPKPVAFHLVQLTLYLCGAFVLYCIFRHFLRPLLALALVLIFVVHPLNTQDVFAIPSMQDALFFLFGTMALLILIRYKSARSMIAAVGCLFLSLLSKEAALAFVLISVLYLFWFDRTRLKPFLGYLTLPFVLYLVLKSNAVGLIGRHPKGGPIDNFGLEQRMYTVPSLIFFYASKLVYPNQLANNFYWVYPNFSVRYVLLPLLADLGLASIFIGAGILVWRRLPKQQFTTYLFFMSWMVCGLGIYLQILPLDMTACEGWAYLGMAGLFGGLGIVFESARFRISPNLLIPLLVTVICLLGWRSAMRGIDYQNQLTLARHDIQVSKDDYFAMNNLSQKLIDQGDYHQAAFYARQSVAIYPAVGNYDNLGVALEQSGDYSGAEQAYMQGLKYGEMNILYENLTLIMMLYDKPAATEQMFRRALQAYPNDFRLWLYFALFEGARNNTADARVAVQNAARNGSVPPFIYSHIVLSQAFSMPLLGKTLVIY